MRAPWFNGRGLCFDLETTGPEPFDARIVTATCVEICPTGVVQATEFLADCGVECPAEASAIHGVTNERIKAEGRPIAVVLPAIVTILRDAWDRGLPLIAYNANYDLTVVAQEIERQQIKPLKLGAVLDPFVIDRAVDVYRRGKRKLVDVCAHYQVKQEGAHSSTGDALAAGRLIWRFAGLAVMRGTKLTGLGALSVEQMQRWQKDAHYARQVDYERYSREQKRVGKDGLPEVVEKDWPIRGAREVA